MASGGFNDDRGQISADVDTALLLADQDPSRVLSFVDIDGNVAPEACFLSRQIISHHVSDPQGFFDEFQARVWASLYYSSPLYTAGLHHKVHAAAVRPIFESMVELSDHGRLMDRFLALPFPRMFIYGKQNDDLSYLGQVTEHGVEQAEIPHSAHFPMYSTGTDELRCSSLAVAPGSAGSGRPPTRPGHLS
ncbi:hypothetical protein [Kocuria rosea]|uniref:hypothetical protein n=1 Tax=Kocuria rosea TaxID=1275 RepID=UPI00203C1D05|nr:hypothetical protein [Kocuria rosea]